mmetsp:Transcript_28264/g.84613  ORF Transcript_28264/g.84613 Transcript_28264/m.84613 type:complete len:143 (+) Transcript_28264:82-510(+)
MGATQSQREAAAVVSKSGGEIQAHIADTGEGAAADDEIERLVNAHMSPAAGSQLAVAWDAVTAATLERGRAALAEAKEKASKDEEMKDVTEGVEGLPSPARPGRAESPPPARKRGIPRTPPSAHGPPQPRGSEPRKVWKGDE